MANTDNSCRGDEGFQARLATEAARKASQNERQKRCRARKKAEVFESLHNASDSLPQHGSVDIDRSTSRVAERVALEWFHQTAVTGPEYQRMLLPKILKHPVRQDIMPDYVANSKQMEHAHATVTNIAKGWQHIKGCHSKDDQRARNVLIPMVVSLETGNIRQTSELTCIHRRNLTRGIDRRLCLEARTENAIWAFCGKMKRKDALSVEVCASVVRWWRESTRISPNRKDIIRKRSGRKVWEAHAAHLLLESQLAFYTRFKEAFPEMDIGLRSFERLKPWFVKRLREFNSCCCRYHVQMAELKDAMRTRGLHKHCACSCDICKHLTDPSAECMARTKTVNGVRDLCELVLCPKGELEEFHKFPCIKGECRNCGVELLTFCPSEVDPDNQILVQWRQFENVHVGKNADGEDKQVVRLQHKETSAHTLVQNLKVKLAEFLIHNFEAKWQDNQFKRCLENLHEDQIVSVMDYAENYSFKEQNEIQSQHWFSFQITILVHLTFRLRPHWDGLNPDTRILTEYHYYISDDKQHDNLFAQHCFKLHWMFLEDHDLPLPTEHIVWSDGCSSQFKCARALFFVARYPSLTRSEELPLGCCMQWNHFGSGHGKGRWDGAGAAVKQCLRSEQVKPNGAKLRNAADVVAFLRGRMNQDHAAYASARRDVHRYFNEVKVNDVDRVEQLNARTVPGTRSLHQVRSVSIDKISLHTRTLSCFCKFCMDGGDGPCESAAYVTKFKLIRLEPCNPGDAQWDAEEGEYHVGNDGEMMAATLNVGDHFVVVAEEGNNEGVNFWVLICDETLHMVEEARKVDSWGQEVFFGDQIVVGRYYKQQGRSATSYVLCDGGSTFIYSHLVRAVKFHMQVASHRQKGKRGGQVYNLSANTLEHIESVVGV